MTYSLVYISTATRELTDEDLHQILYSAQHRNDSLDVTGMLLYDGSKFMQLLEGTEKNVATLYARIVLDDRHMDVVTIWTGNETERHYPEWSMGFRRVSESELAGVSGVSNFLDRPNDGVEPTDTVGQALLKTFKELAR